MKNKKTTARSPGLQKEDISSTSSRVGTLLKKRREELKISLEAASEKLCIRKAFLKAIEEGETKDLPERVYTFGFVGSYASFLDLDKEALLLEYQKEHNDYKDPDFIAFPDPLPKKGIPSYASYILGLLILVLGIGLWVSFRPTVTPVDEKILPAQKTVEKEEQEYPVVDPAQGASSTSKSSPEKNGLSDPSLDSPQEEKEVFSSTPLPSADLSPSTLTLPSSEILLTAKERVWVQISNASGIPTFTKVMKPGESYQLPQAEEAYLTIGNAGGLEISIDQKTLPPLGTSGQVIRNFPLNAQKLLEQVSSGEKTL